ncbi:EF-hand domain-containing protein [Motiliproteus coralliicola]|uniref:EF-hand domain-containing protein n=1 Tax=Motiliproteus coralliicola TaxID=2283196 RepID=A0A369WTM7_9GAMM|nr:EF-hand domain-containing protein [Motiliproteus coralliicola]RDE24409.1 EF-hand domain-containing protein [Motiliproteus coralliicola]
MKIKTLCAIAFATTSLAAYAAEKPEFTTVDADADGFISAEEAATVPGLSEVFVQSDMDKDGKLSEAEYSEIS